MVNGSRPRKKGRLSITTRRPPASSSTLSPLAILNLTQWSSRRSRSCSKNLRQCCKDWRVMRTLETQVQMALVDRSQICKAGRTTVQTQDIRHRMSIQERRASGPGERLHMEPHHMGTVDGTHDSRRSKSALYQNVFD